MKHNLHILLPLCGAFLAGCSAPPIQAPIFDPSGVEVGQRALPTHGKNARTNAHVDHVFLDSGAAGYRSVETITIEDAVANDVLATSDFEIVDLKRSHIQGASVEIVRLDRALQRPTQKESVGGYGIDDGISSEVNFDLGESVMLNPEKLSHLVEMAAEIPGQFTVVGYTDPQGSLSLNLGLSISRADAVAEALVNAGVHPSRISVQGMGVSTKYPDH